jgi:hypothetical protein
MAIIFYFDEIFAHTFQGWKLVVPDNEGCNLFSRTSEIGRLAKRILSNSCAGGMFSLESAFGHILVYCS